MQQPYVGDDPEQCHVDRRCGIYGLHQPYVGDDLEQCHVDRKSCIPFEHFDTWVRQHVGDFGNSVTSMGRRCTSLTSVNSVTSIGNRAFDGVSVIIDNSSLTSVTIPNSVTSIGDKEHSGVHQPYVGDDPEQCHVDRDRAFGGAPA